MTGIRNAESAPSLSFVGDTATRTRPAPAAPQTAQAQTAQAQTAQAQNAQAQTAQAQTAQAQTAPPEDASAAATPSAGQAEAPARPRRLSAKVAIPSLAVLAAAAIALVAVIVGMASRGLATAAGTVAAGNPLVYPAPAVAGGLPRHNETTQNVVTIALIDKLEARFAVLGGSSTHQPSAVYREPASVDPVTDQPGWVLYLGHNSPADLGSSRVTVSRLMADLIRTTAAGTSWAASPGQLGGSARCAIAVISHTTVSVCAWATERSYGALMSPTSDTRGNQLAVLLPQMRLDLQP